MCKTTFKIPLRKLQNILGMKFRTDVTLLFLSAVNNEICLLFMVKVWNLKLTESMNIFCISDRVASAIKLNIEETWWE